MHHGSICRRFGDLTALHRTQPLRGTLVSGNLGHVGLRVNHVCGGFGLLRLVDLRLGGLGWNIGDLRRRRRSRHRRRDRTDGSVRVRGGDLLAVGVLATQRLRVLSSLLGGHDVDDRADEDERRGERVDADPRDERRVVATHQLDPESSQAVAGDVEREEPAVPEFESLVSPQQDRENQQVPQQFVEERRVHGPLEQRHTGRHAVEHVALARRVHAVVDDQAPRHVRLAAVQLLIEVIAQTPDRLGHDDARRDGVAERGQRNAALPAAQPRTDAAERDRTPDTEAAVPDPQCAHDSGATLTEVRRPVGDDVIEPAAHEAERHRPQSDVVDDAPLAAAGRPAPVADDQRGDDARDNAQRVRTNREDPQVPDTLGRAGDTGQDRRGHAEILWRTPSASSAVRARTADRPFSSADTSAEPTITPSA